MAHDPFAAFPGSVVLDGGLASELERNGADLRDPLWSAKVLLDEPGRVVDVHRAYVEAGAQVVIGASYQASFEGLARRGFDRRAAERVLASSVELAREGAAGRALVAASIGPYGAFLANGAEYTGDYGLGDDEHARAALHDFHRPRAEALAAASPDLFAVETIPSLLEADVLVQVLHEIGDVPAWVSFSCRDDMHLCDGSPIEDAVDVIDASPQVIAIGVNCTPPAHVPGLLRRAATRTANVASWPTPIGGRCGTRRRRPGRATPCQTGSARWREDWPTRAPR